MYISNKKQIMMTDDFLLPFGGKPGKQEPWVKACRYITLVGIWQDRYIENFMPSYTGERAYSVRVVFETLIVKRSFFNTDI